MNYNAISDYYIYSTSLVKNHSSCHNLLQLKLDIYTISVYRVRTGPGKSLKLKKKNPGLENPGILLKVLESPGILNSEKKDCKNSICLSLKNMLPF